MDLTFQFSHSHSWRNSVVNHVWIFEQIASFITLFSWAHSFVLFGGISITFSRLCRTWKRFSNWEASSSEYWQFKAFKQRIMKVHPLTFFLSIVYMLLHMFTHTTLKSTRRNVYNSKHLPPLPLCTNYRQIHLILLFYEHMYWASLIFFRPNLTQHSLT